MNGHAHSNLHCNDCHGDDHGDHSIEEVFDSDASSIAASGKNEKVIARCNNATVHLPDDLESGETFTVVVPTGVTGVRLRAPDGVRALAANLTTLNGPAAVELVFVDNECECGEFICVGCPPAPLV